MASVKRREVVKVVSEEGKKTGEVADGAEARIDQAISDLTGPTPWFAFSLSCIVEVMALRIGMDMNKPVMSPSRAEKNECTQKFLYTMENAR
jgi:hypothetical protein